MGGWIGWVVGGGGMRGKDCEGKRGEGFKNGIGNKCIRHMRAAIWPIRRAGNLGVFSRKLEGRHSLIYHYFDEY